ncbi:hypothetical protein J3D54_004648 [Pseudomonas sp. GGS8]|uniref:hypothetical protein n=1 Tax=Pseudomonas sp. GGS8 TaxID=2817892 RepID=UPI0020A04251|nr:hypothetical protein [Pseudomonas sp. GGS8]MCP1445516.1 hypothetical protein [Pseudomonas sp. GGS8]
MSKFDSGLRLPVKPPRTPLKTEIMWGCESGGSHHFPRDIETIHTRRHSPAPRPLEAFSKAVSSAVDRIWVVDEYFLKPDTSVQPDGRILTILDWLHAGLVASDIRILTRMHAEVPEDMLQLFQMREEEINTRQARRAKCCSIQVNTRLRQDFDYIHDRFAVVDDELWHFGATVGGFHASVNAASRGWCAVDSGAIAFFELAWDKCKEK